MTDPIASTPEPPAPPKRSWEPELSVGGWLALSLTVLFGGTTLLAGAQAAVDPPKLGVEDGLTFGWIFLSTLPLALGSAAFVGVLAHQFRVGGGMPGYFIFVFGATCVGLSVWFSAWALDAGVKSAIDSALGYLPSPDNTSPPAGWPGWADAYWTAAGDSPGEILQRGLDVYLKAYGPLLFVASLAVGAYAGYCASKISANES